MRDRLRFYGFAFVATLALLPSPGFSQAQIAQTRIPQQIVINGQNASGAYVATAGGQIQSFTCSSPQQYTTADGSSRGWACYEQTTGVWLLSAVPPTPAQAAPAPAPVAAPPQMAPMPPMAPVMMPTQPPVIYQQAPPTVVYQPVPVVYQPPPTVIYSQPATVIYSQPAPTTVVYAPAPRPIIVAPTYPSSVVIGRAAIEAAGRIASAAIIHSNQPRVTYNIYDYDRDRHYDRGRGRR